MSITNSKQYDWLSQQRLSFWAFSYILSSSLLFLSLWLSDCCDHQAPGYTDVIRQPMDFSTIQSKLSDDQYSTVEEVIADIRLMFSNCSVYYSMPTSPQRLAGSRLSRHFERRLKELRLATTPTSSATAKSSRASVKRAVNHSSKWSGVKPPFSSLNNHSPCFHTDYCHSALLLLAGHQAGHLAHKTSSQILGILSRQLMYGGVWVDWKTGGGD